MAIDTSSPRSRRALLAPLAVTDRQGVRCEGGATVSVHRRLAAALIAGGLLAGTIVAPASAAVAPTLRIDVGESCVYWDGAPSTTYKITLIEGTEVLDADSAASDEGGWGYVCLGVVVDPGMKVRISTTGYTRTVTVPRLSVQTDRIGDVVFGAAPAGKSIRIMVVPYKTGTYTYGTDITRTVTATASGAYTVDMTAAGGFRGGDHVWVAYINPATGDMFSASDLVEFMRVTRGSSRVTGIVNHGVTVLELRTSAGALRGRAFLTAGSGWWAQGSFATSAGSHVAVRTGDKIVGDFASDATMTVPAITITADPATDIVTLTCPGMAGQGARIEVRKSDWSASASPEGVMNAPGVRAWDVTADVNLVRGDKLWGVCKYDSGDEIARHGIVP